MWCGGAGNGWHEHGRRSEAQAALVPTTGTSSWMASSIMDGQLAAAGRGRCAAVGGELLQQRGEFSLDLRSPAGRWPGWLCKRVFSRWRRAISCSRGSVGGRPRIGPSRDSAPASRWLRHSEISEVYKPSRRSSAPLPSRSAALVLSQDPQLVRTRKHPPRRSFGNLSLARFTAPAQHAGPIHPFVITIAR